MRTRKAVALSLQASSRVMKEVMSYQWYLWVYGYQRSDYLKYSGYIYIYSRYHLLHIYIYVDFLSPLKFINSPDRWELLQKICDPWSHLTRVCHIKCSISGWSAYEKNLEGLGEMLRQYDSWTMIMIQIWDLPGPTSMHHLVLRLPIIGLFFGSRLVSDSQIPCLRDFVHGISTCPPWLEKPLTCHA